MPNGRSRDSFSTGYTANKQVFPKVNKGPTYLGARDTQEADRHEHTSNRHLVVAKLDSVEILHAETVRRDEAVERKNLVHLNRSNESAATLSDNVRDYKHQLHICRVAHQQNLLADTWDSFEVKGAAQDASPSFIFGTSSSESISVILSVIEARSNYHK